MYKFNTVTSEMGNGQLFSFKALHLYTSILKFWSSVTEKNKNFLKIIKSYPRERTLFYFVLNKWLIMGIFLDKHNFKSLTHTHFLMQKYPSFQWPGLTQCVFNFFRLPTMPWMHISLAWYCQVGKCRFHTMNNDECHLPEKSEISTNPIIFFMFIHILQCRSSVHFHQIRYQHSYALTLPWVSTWAKGQRLVKKGNQWKQKREVALKGIFIGWLC